MRIFFMSLGFIKLKESAIKCTEMLFYINYLSFIYICDKFI